MLWCKNPSNLLEPARGALVGAEGVRTPNSIVKAVHSLRICGAPFLRVFSSLTRECNLQRPFGSDRLVSFYLAFLRWDPMIVSNLCWHFSDIYTIWTFRFRTCTMQLSDFTKSELCPFWRLRRLQIDPSGSKSSPNRPETTQERYAGPTQARSRFKFFDFSNIFSMSTTGWHLDGRVPYLAAR